LISSGPDHNHRRLDKPVNWTALFTATPPSVAILCTTAIEPIELAERANCDEFAFCLFRSFRVHRTVLTHVGSQPNRVEISDRKDLRWGRGEATLRACVFTCRLLASCQRDVPNSPGRRQRSCRRQAQSTSEIPKLLTCLSSLFYDDAEIRMQAGMQFSANQGATHGSTQYSGYRCESNAVGTLGKIELAWKQT
jgi:hypothetical protein